MGLFSIVRFTPPVNHLTVTKLVNSNGVSLHDVEFQTKDLDADMLEYIIQDRSMYRVLQCFSPSSRTISGSYLITKTEVEKINISGDIIIYGYDIKTPAVYYTTDSNFGGFIDSVHPFCEYNLFFREGILKDIKILKTPSRDGVIEELPGRVLSDTDPAVLKYTKGNH